MPIRIWSLALCLVPLLNACGPLSVDEPYVAIRATPRSIDDKGQTTSLQVSASTGLANGSGKVLLTATAGIFPDGTELTLEDGTAKAPFACAVALDKNCKGTVSVTAEWTYKSEVYTSTVKIDVGVLPDAGGNPATGDGGTDGGTSSDGGSADGGAGGPEYVIELKPDKTRMAAGTSDKIDVLAKLKYARTGAVVDRVPLTFKANLGSFASGATVREAVVDTNSAGEARVSLFGQSAAAGKATIEVTGADAKSSTELTLLDVADILFVVNPSTKSQIRIQSAGRDNSTRLYFKVADSNGAGVEGIEVLFSMTGPSDATLVTSAFTDASGQAFTTLQSGNTVGLATVTARVKVATSLAEDAPNVRVVHPSDRNFMVECDTKNLAAMNATSLARTLSTNCRAQVNDRFSNRIGLETRVYWLSEAGAIEDQVNTLPQTPGANASNVGVAVASFQTTPPLPQDVTADSSEGEPSDGTKNPRDMLVTLIAAVEGEEDFYDGSGASNGTTNGRWDAGEWFVDLSEPFVDANDNNRYDVGEPFIDTLQKDCSNPNAAPTKNSKWDPPNGCWDAVTLVWRATHVVYSGPLTRSVEFSGVPPFQVAAAGNLSVGFSWGDSWFGRLSDDTANITLTSLSGTRGSGTVTSDASTDGFAFDVLYDRWAVDESATTAGLFTVIGLCNNLSAPPPNGRIRCMHRYTVENYRGGSSGTLLFTNALTPGTPENRTFRLEATHGVHATPVTGQIQVNMQ